MLPSLAELAGGQGLGCRGERERDLRKETVYCSLAWDCGKGSLGLAAGTTARWQAAAANP